MTEEDLKKRTRAFALAILKAVGSAQRSLGADVLTRQLIRSGTSVAANYRAVCRARSTAEFISKLGIVEEESDESVFWLGLLVDAGFLHRQIAEPLMKEGNELTAIFVASIKTARRRKKS